LALVDDIVNNPLAVKSDSFYFVDGELIMHNKARYRYFYSKARESKLAGGDDSDEDDIPRGNRTASTASKLMSSDEDDDDDDYASSKIQRRSGK